MKCMINLFTVLGLTVILTLLPILFAEAIVWILDEEVEFTGWMAFIIQTLVSVICLSYVLLGF